MSQIWKTYPQETLPGDVSKSVVFEVEKLGFEVRAGRSESGLKLGIIFNRPLNVRQIRKLQAQFPGHRVTKNWLFV